MDLLNACKNGDGLKALELLNNNYSNYSCIDDENYTPLIWACKNKMTDVALKLLETPKLCKMNQINDNFNTALTWSLDNVMTEVSEKILEYPYLCNLNIVNMHGYTPLIYACRHKENEQIAL